MKSQPSFLIRAALLLLLALGFASGVQATTYTYTNSTGYWSAANNWSPNTAPTAGGAFDATILFTNPAVSVSTNNLAGAFYLNLLQMAASNNATFYSSNASSLLFTNNGATLPLITNNTAKVLTIYSTLALATNLTVGGISNGTIIINSNITENTAGTQLIKTGTNQLTLTASNTYTGGTLISGGTVNVTNLSALGTGAVTNNSTLNLLVATTSTYTSLAGTVTGSGTLNIALGAGATASTISGNFASYTGVINIGTNTVTGTYGGGKVVLNSLPATAVVNIFSNATLYISATYNAPLTLYGGNVSEPYGQLRLDGATWAGPVTIAGAASPFTIGSHASGGTISGPIGEANGSQTLSKGGDVRVALTGTNTYTGSTIIGGSSYLTIGGSGRLGGVSGQYAGSIIISNTAALVYGSSAAQTFSGGISGGGSLTNNGTGLLTLTGTNTYGGTNIYGTVINSGTLLVNSPGSLASAVTVNAGGTFGGSGTISNTVTVSSGATLAPGGVNAIGTLTLGTNLTLTAASLLTFDIASPTSYDKIVVGGSNIVNGTAIIQLNPTTGTITNLAGGYTLITYANRSGGLYVFPNGSTNMGGLTLTNGATSLTLGMSGNVGLTNLIWRGTNTIWDKGITYNWLNNGTAATYQDGVNVNVTFDDTAATGTVAGTNLAPGSVIFNNNATNYTISATTNTIGGTAAVTKLGAGMVTFAGTNLFAGGLNILNGTVSLTTSANAGGVGAITLGNTSGNANATLSGDGRTFTNAITVQGTGTNTIGNSGSTAAVFSGNIALNKPLTLLAGGTGSVKLSGNITGSSLITVTNDGAVVSTAQYVDLTNNNSGFTGNVAVNGGMLRLENSTPLNSANIVQMNYTNTMLNLNANADVTLAGLTGVAGSVVTNTSGAGRTLTLAGAGQYAFNGAIVDTNGTGTRISLVFTGSGTNVFGGTNTYSGTTLITNGTLLVNGSILGTNTVTVTNTGIFGGSNGVIRGPVTFNAGTFAQFTLGAPLNFSNSLTLNGSPQVQVVLTNNTPLGTYVLATNASATGSFNNTPVIIGGSLARPNFTTNILTTATNVVLVVGTIPDTLALVAATPNPSVYGGAVVFTATVQTNLLTTTNAAGDATSGVIFSVDSTPVATNAVASGAASYTNNTLTAGSHIIKAIYQGDANYAASTNSLTQTVTPLPVLITGTRAYDGTAVATNTILLITNGVNGDNVTNALTAGYAALAGATVGPQGIIATNHLTLANSGVATNYTLVGASGTVVITQASATYTAGVSLVSSSPTNGYWSGVNFTSTVPSFVNSGNVVFLTTNGAFSTNAISGGIAVSLTITNLPRGTNLITAQYAGDANVVGWTNSIWQVTTNHPPVAATMTVTGSTGMPLAIALADVATNWTDVDGDPIYLTGVNLTTTNGVNLMVSNYIYTTNWVFTNGFTYQTNSTPDGSLVSIVTNSWLNLVYTNGPSVADQLSYSISDGQGGTNVGYINIVLSTNSLVGTNSIASITNGNPTTVTAYGVIGASYATERATNLAPAEWVILGTNAAGTNGVISVSDYFGDLGSNAPSQAYYRLRWVPKP